MKKVPSKLPSLTFKFSDLFSVDYYLITPLLIFLPALIYWQVYDFEFLWDDDNGKGMGHMFNAFVLNPTLENLSELFLKPFFGMYIPVSYFLWGVLKSLADLLSLSPNGVLHLSNVVIHVANGLLVFVILRQFIANKWAVLVGVLFFLLHPIQVEAVAWVSEFRGLLASFFSLLSLYWYMKNKAELSYWSLLFLLLALLSKPSAVVLVLFVFLINHFHYHFSLKNNIYKTLPFAIIALCMVIVAYLIQSKYALNFSEYLIPFWQRPFAWLDSIIFYSYQLIFPYNLSASYALSPQFIIQQWWFYPLSLIPLLAGWALYLVRHKYPLLVFSVLLFIAGFFTTSGLVSFAFQKYSLVADRYLYLSMMGVGLFVASILAKTDKKQLWFLLSGIVLVYGSLSAFRQIPIWQSPIDLWVHSQQFEVNSSYAQGNAHESLQASYYNKGLAFANAGDIQQALEYFDKVIANYSTNRPYELKHSDLFYNRGIIMFRQKKYQQALENFNQAIKIKPKNIAAYNGKIVMFIDLKQCKKSWDEIQKMREKQIKIPKDLLATLQRVCKK
ncbi:O-GlcNAc transferase [uncultured Candidatus Thioglobus sp.]|nr:O-GlcNAc transferase [uncultured Candidatus Thioglobus sp.]